MAGVAIGVASLIVVLSVMNGFYDFVQDLLTASDPHIRIESVEGGLAQSDSLLRVVKSQALVTNAASMIQGQALLLHDGLGGDVNKVVIVKGVQAEDYERLRPAVFESVSGSKELGRREGHPGLIVGRDLADRLLLRQETELGSASRVSILSAPGLEQLLTQLWAIPTSPSFDVRGIYDLGTITDESVVYVDIDEARRLFRLSGMVTSIEVELSDLNKASDVKKRLEAILPVGQYRVQTWYDLQRSQYSVMKIEKWAASFILMLIVLVAAFNIIGSLTMVVIEKRRDVGVLMAMGVKKSSVRRIFLYEGVLLGVIGTGIGLVVGLTLVWLQGAFELVPLARAESFLIDAYPVAARPLDIVLIVVAAVGLCILASLYPAARAASVLPATAIAADG